MVRSRLALIGASILLGICLFLDFSISNEVKLNARIRFMSFPIKEQDGYIVIGIIGSVLFILALILVVIGLKKYHFRTVVTVAIIFGFSPFILMTIYQETMADGIKAISYDGNGTCRFETQEKDILTGECSFILHNHSNEAVTFTLEFLDSVLMEDDVRMESLMNLAGPYRFTIEANDNQSINLKEILDVSGVPMHIESGTSSMMHFKLSNGGTYTIL